MRPEHWLFTIPLRLRSLFRWTQADQELDDELRDHLERKTEEYIAQGMRQEEAHRRARLDLEGIEQTKEKCRDARRVNWIQDFIQDLHFGLRMLRKSPGFTAVAVLTLALGIGANTAIFSLINAVMLETLPVKNPQQLVLLDWTSGAWPEDIVKGLAGTWYKEKSGRATSTSFPYAIYDDICARNQTFSSLAAFAGNGSQLNVGYKGQPGRADGELVSGTFFSTLGVPPILGRLFTVDDDRLGASPAAVISYVYWEQRFGRDPGVIGKTLTINSVPFTIIGVSASGFFGVEPGRSVDIWVPLHTQPQVEPSWSPVQPDSGKPSASNSNYLFEARDGWWVVIIGRLMPAVDQQQARTALEVTLQQSMAPQVKSATKPQTIPHIGLESASKGLDYLRKEFSKPLFILMTVAGLVLLIACANVANLLLARSKSRQKEISVRLAIGARRGRLVRQLLTEGLLLAALGGAASVILAFWGTNMLVAFMASGRWPISLSVSPDLRVFGFAATVSMLSGILFGLSPALRSTQVDLTPALKESPGDMSPGARGKSGIRLGLAEGLIVTQVSLSLVLLVGAGLFVRTLTSLQSVNLGFNEHNLLLFSIDPTQDGYSGQRLANFYQDLMRRLESLPGVRSVSLSHSTLIGGGGNWQMLHIGGYVPKSGEEVGAAVNWIGQNFFETLGIPVVLGRSVTEGDTESAPKVVVVNERFVRQFLGAGNPIGRRIGLGDKGGQDVEIVGVVADTKYFDLREDAPETIYLPWQQYPNGAMNFEVRTLQNPMELTAAVRQVAQNMDRNLALYDVRSQVEQISKTLSQERLFARLTSFFGALAMLLACVGIYGVMGFAVTRRTREIGIRMALGASRSEIANMVLRETLALVGIGMILGIIVALGASRLVASMLYGIKPDNPLTIAIAALLMVAAALLAAYFPVRRAASVDPMVALRYE